MNGVPATPTPLEASATPQGSPTTPVYEVRGTSGDWRLIRMKDGTVLRRSQYRWDLLDNYPSTDLVDEVTGERWRAFERSESSPEASA